MDKVQIRAREVFRIGAYSFESDDVQTVPREIAEIACGQGWAEDVSGAIETGERKPGNVEAVPRSVVQEAV